MKRIHLGLAAGAVLLSAALAHGQTPVMQRPLAAPKVDTSVDVQAQLQREREKSARLQEENQGLKAQLAEWTRKGGSLVHAYCETPTVSMNSSGARSDCAATGYGCEPVSGLCRTTVRASDECATGFLMNGDPLRAAQPLTRGSAGGPRARGAHHWRAAPR